MIAESPLQAGAWRGNTAARLISAVRATGAVLAVLTALGGCVARAPAPVETWDLTVRGKIALRDGSEGFSARFAWRQVGEAYDVQVWGPLGQGRVRLQGDRHSMQIYRGETLLDAGPPERVMQRHLGWTVPVAVIPAWLHGRPWQSGVSVEPPIEDATPPQERRFEELGWQVRMSRFAPSSPQDMTAQALFTPRRIVATRQNRKITLSVGDFAH